MTTHTVETLVNNARRLLRLHHMRVDAETVYQGAPPEVLLAHDPPGGHPWLNRPGGPPRTAAGAMLQHVHGSSRSASERAVRGALGLMRAAERDPAPETYDLPPRPVEVYSLSPPEEEVDE